ncbi:MAG: hypothetical protein MK142_16200 [Pseudomonadales bacterium]|nr:hypothetical protein [Pseudomonadales bacterium]
MITFLRWTTSPAAPLLRQGTCAAIRERSKSTLERSKPVRVEVDDMKLLEFLADCERQQIPMTQREAAARQQFGERLAIIMADSVGFSRITQEAGIVHFISKMASARSLLGTVLQDSSATAFSFHADNCIAFFKTPDQALDAAIAMQRVICESGLALNGREPYGLSIGLGYGDVLRAGDEEGYFGNEVNLASKLGEDIEGRDSKAGRSRPYMR